MANFKLELNLGGLVALSNAANVRIAEPLAQRVAASAGPGHEVQKTGRRSVGGWARTRVVTTTPEAMAAEVREGRLSRAFRGL